MKLDIVFGIVIGVGVGYIIAKKIDDLPTMKSGSKTLTGRQAIEAAYKLGAYDGKNGKAYGGADTIGYLQSIT